MSTRDLVDEGIAAGCLEWVPDDHFVRALSEVREAPVRSLVTVKLTLTVTVPVGSITADAAMDAAEAYMRRALPDITGDLKAYGADDVVAVVEAQGSEAL